MISTNPETDKLVHAIIDDTLKKHDAMVQPGLSRGLAGLTAFLYYGAKFTGNTQLEKIGGKLIDKIYNQMSQKIFSTDFVDGLTGIGCMIEYLVQNRFVEADTDVILEDVDNKIFRAIAHVEKIPFGIRNGLLGYATYLILRLKNCNDRETRFILENLLIEIINKASLEIEKGNFNAVEPLNFNVFWNLPVLLAILSECIKLEIHKQKIYQVIYELEPVVLSFIPIKSSNRLFLLLGVGSIAKTVRFENWHKHAELLKDSLNIHETLTNEFGLRNIFVANGLTGVLILTFIFREVMDFISLKLDYELFFERIQNSEIIKNLERESKDIPLGILNGVAGIALTRILVSNLEKDR